MPFRSKVCRERESAGPAVRYQQPLSLSRRMRATSTGQWEDHRPDLVPRALLQRPSRR
ncbi:MAG: hypothetical protein JWP48_4036 [Actinoallomurus sp.]|jgi:hypothetical protein|nr:hypothetical protein [Actinoallomurus sp.]